MPSYYLLGLPEFREDMEPRDAWAMALYYAEGCCADAEWETDTVEYARLDGPFELDMEIKEEALRPATERLTPEDRRYLETTAGCIIKFEKTNGSVWVLWYESNEELEAAWDRILQQPAAEPDEFEPPF